MRTFRLLLAGALLMMYTAAPAQAQANPAGPTVIVRSAEGILVWIVWTDDTFIMLAPTPTFWAPQYCGTEPWPGDIEDWVFLKSQDVFPAQMKQIFQIKGPVFTRVYKPWVEPPDVFAEGYLCDLLSGNLGAPFAEGISDLRIQEANSCARGPGAPTWHFQATGHLSAPSCAPTAMAAFRYDFKVIVDNDVVVDKDCNFDWDTYARVLFIDLESRCIGRSVP